jgi:uroporphyrinogen III methyltransferase/synthase
MSMDPKRPKSGFVTIAGAGPGHPELITNLASRRLSEADVILYDRLIDPEILSLASPGAETKDVGKQPGSGAEQQERIIEMLIEHASAGKRVVRLKGGDPLVFGRGAEEALALAAAGIPFEIIPGVTSAIAGPAYAGIPLTHRDISRAFAVVTGKAASGEAPSDDEVDWPSLARFEGTLVFLMARSTLETVTTRLVDAGKDPNTPAAMVANATLPSQRVVVSSLGEIAGDAADAGIESPAVLVIGDVVGLREKVEWVESRPLAGKTVLVTRPIERSSAIAEALRDLGAGVVIAPSIETRLRHDLEELRDAVERVGGGGFSWIVFASKTGVDAFFDALHDKGGDARSLAGTKIACVGATTSAALRTRGIEADFMPKKSTAAALAEELPLGYRAEQVLVVRPTGGRPELIQKLEERGFDVDTVEAYETVRPSEADERIERARALLAKREISAVVFASSSQVENFAELFGADLAPPVKVCIGPTTAEAARQIGIEPTKVASDQSVDGLIEALIEAFSSIR